MGKQGPEGQGLAQCWRAGQAGGAGALPALAPQPLLLSIAKGRPGVNTLGQPCHSWLWERKMLCKVESM